MTLAEYTASWLIGRTGRLAPNSLAAYRSALAHHVLPRFGPLEMPAITTAAVRTWLAECLATAPRAAVVAYHAALCTVLTDAVLEGHLPTNPAHGAGRRLWPRKRTQLPKALDRDQLALLFHAADLDALPWFGAFVRIAARSGLRLGELLALNAQRLLPEVPAIRVEMSYDGGGRFGLPKSGKPRVVEVSRETMDLCLGRPQGWLFPGRGRLPASPSRVQRTMVTVVARAGLPSHFTAHNLRHTYASMLLAAGAPAQWVQQQLGHASYQLTVDVYGSWLPARRPDLPRLLDGTEPVHHPPRPARMGTIIPFRRRLRA